MDDTRHTRLPELTESEIQAVSGGIIVIGGLNQFPLPDPWIRPEHSVAGFLTNPAELVALNPQPLPPKAVLFAVN